MFDILGFRKPLQILKEEVYGTGDLKYLNHDKEFEFDPEQATW